MKNPKAMVEIKLDKKRMLKFDFNAYCTLEDTLAISLAEVSNPMSLGLRAHRAMLYCGLLHEDDNLTLAEVGQFFDDYDRKYILDKIVEAVKAANPEPEGEGEETPNPPQHVGTGS